MASSIDLNKEIVFATSDTDISHQIGILLKQGLLRKIAPRLYTTNFSDSPENIVRRNILSILMWHFPGAIISHRSACEMRLTPMGLYQGYGTAASFQQHFIWTLIFGNDRTFIYLNAFASPGKKHLRFDKK